MIRKTDTSNASRYQDLTNLFGTKGFPKLTSESNKSYVNHENETLNPREARSNAPRSSHETRF